MYTEYYNEKLQQGLEYQDFVTDILFNELFIPLSSYQSKKYQLKGENKQGIEIKFDGVFDETRNPYIEISEKTNASNINFIPSGIYRSDNTWLYIVGNYNILFIFGKELLKLLHKTKRYKEVGIPTSNGFLIPEKDAKKYALKIIYIKNN
jgi:hypothetical protein